MVDMVSKKGFEGFSTTNFYGKTPPRRSQPRKETKNAEQPLEQRREHKSRWPFGTKVSPETRTGYQETSSARPFPSSSRLSQLECRQLFGSRVALNGMKIGKRKELNKFKKQELTASRLQSKRQRQLDIKEVPMNVGYNSRKFTMTFNSSLAEDHERDDGKRPGSDRSPKSPKSSPTTPRHKSPQSSPASSPINKTSSPLTSRTSNNLTSSAKSPDLLGPSSSHPKYNQVNLLPLGRVFGDNTLQTFRQYTDGDESEAYSRQTPVKRGRGSPLNTSLSTETCWEDGAEVNNEVVSAPVFEMRKSTPSDPLPLRNLGNTCYLNSMVQSLFAMPLMINYLTDSYQEIFVMHGEATKSQLPMTYAFLSLYVAYYNNRESLNYGNSEELEQHIRDLKECVGNFQSQFKSTHQQDTVEFLTLVLSTIEEEFEKVKEFDPTKNPIVRYFQFHVRNQLKCTTCGDVIYPPQLTMNALYLSMPDVGPQKEFYLQNIVNDYFGRDHKQEIKCEKANCAGNEKIENIFLTKAPNVLAIQVGRYSGAGQEKRHEIVYISGNIRLPRKRFPDKTSAPSSPSPRNRQQKTVHPLNEKTNSPVKANKLVESNGNSQLVADVTESETLQRAINLSLEAVDNVSFNRNEESRNGFEEGSDKENSPTGKGSASSSVTYRLAAVVCHHGSSLDGGHYVAYAVGFNTNEWYSCDDDIITPVDFDRVIEESKTSGYCFFYLHQSLSFLST